MIFGMTTATYTLLHVLISLAGIASGFIVVLGLLARKSLNGWTGFFLTTTALTSITGFGFPIEHLTPGLILGIISLVVLALTIPARYVFHMSGGWRRVFVIGSALALYFNVFVLVVQSFEKVPALKAAAPTQKELPFVIAQVLVLVIFTVLTILAMIRFHPESTRTA
jgi:hypothetical protein